ncbi:hypothetical protein F4778DRAFT_533239 [Xylariomycetidae sp. FL2044]|nr:hypothetical protein F4778DRAFT_533239 [Xylariomycetidae sp. FL2044]
MRPGLYSMPYSHHYSALTLLLPLAFAPFCHSIPSVLSDLQENYHSPAPAPEDGPPFSAEALRSTAYLPAQIGGIVGAYAFSLVVVAALLLILAKKRREHLRGGEEDIDEALVYQFAFPGGYPNSDISQNPQYFPQYPTEYPKSPRSPITNFSYPTPPTPSAEKGPGPYIYPAPQSSSTLASPLGVDLSVDQRVVAADREMAQQQLEEMYKHVMEQEAAKQAGITLDEPPAPISKKSQEPPIPPQGILKKGKNKPVSLDLNQPQPEKQSRGSSFLSALKSPRKKNVKGISISSPIMTPMSGTFPRYEGEEMNSIPPRQYAPASPPPIPMDQQPYRGTRHIGPAAPLTPPDVSPESTQSIDERLGGQYGHSRYDSQQSEAEPVSAISDRSTSPLVGLPTSPKPGVNRFPTLPASPKPGATFPLSPQPGARFSRPNAPSAVRTGGALPLRAYEPSLASPSVQTTKQTTFERAAPLSPSGLRTPWTGAPVPYTPYQPFSPVIPMTPSLVTKADRKRMKQLQPKTPTVEMVKSSDDIW